ncbi:MAG TPA: hypothetical protein VHT53_13755 [Candidatus Elarobacter sp.]|jgi:hypothetical protein|nr:hypothetical protein [Candidatus Elarobacter sp.]
MRTHRTHATIAPWSTATPVLDPDRLAVVRVEPVLYRRRTALVLDACLANGDALTIVPGIVVEPAIVIDRDRDPLVFPFGAPGDDAFASALADRVLPHLEPLVLGGGAIAEHVVRFAPAPAFDAARAAGCFGAAPLRDALARLAPYRFARRFVRGRSVRIDAPDAAGGWALLRDAAAAGIAPQRRTHAELAWYGDAPAALPRADVAIVGRDADPGDAACVVRVDPELANAGGRLVEAVDPLPLDVAFSFDPAEGPVRRWFAVERVLEPARASAVAVAPTASGGSSGRIAIVLGRADWALRPSADVDEARALAAALRAEGFDAFVADTADALRGADLIHVLGVRDGRRVRAVVDAARRDGVPVAVHAYDEDAESGGWWGAEVTRHCFEYGADERDLQTYLGMLARRAVAVGDARSDVRYAPATAGAEDGAAALRDATVVFAATAAEADAIRARTGRAGPIEVVPPLLEAVTPEAVGALVGSDPFVLAHAPIGPIGNQLLLARCALEADVPLVLAGPVVDASYLERVREFGGASTIVVPGEPRPETAAGLRAAAAVVADAAWIGDGSVRLAAAALTGAVLVVADRRRFEGPAGVRRFDPGDAAALTRALGEAWDEALRTARRRPPGAGLAPEATLRAIVRGYASAASRP